MIDKIIEAGGGSPTGLSAALKDGGDDLAKLIQSVLQVAMDWDNGLRPEAKLFAELKSDEQRGQLLERLVREIVPERVNPELFAKWLQGGENVYNPRLRKVAPGSERPCQTVERCSTRVFSQERRIEKLKRERAALDQRIAQAKEKLALIQAEEKAAVFYQTADLLIRILTPAAAMGPLWTVARALSAHPSDGLVEFHTGFYGKKEKPQAVARFRVEHAEESVQIWSSLYHFSGDWEFEVKLRDAIKEVVMEFEPRRENERSQGVRPKGERRMETQINPSTQYEKEKVIDGFVEGEL